MTADSRAPRPGQPWERKADCYWREVCSCGWVGRQHSSHRAAKDDGLVHVRVKFGWYGDPAATTPPSWDHLNGGR